jgi:lipopolysaccharide heptosyltransferase II
MQNVHPATPVASEDDLGRLTDLAAARSFVPVAGGDDPARLLAALLCPIGDTLFATPALAALRRRFPRAHITALVYQSNAGILDGNPSIDERVVVSQGGREPRLIRFARGVATGVATIEGAQYDLMVNFSPTSSFVGFLGGVPRQAHLKMPRHWWLVGGRSPDYRAQHAVDHYLEVVRPLLLEDVPQAERQPRVYVSAAHRAAARRLLRESGVRVTEPLLAMHVGADGFGGRKRWSPDRFARVGERLAERFGMRVLLLGGAADIARSQDVAAAMPRGAVILAGRTSLLETAALIERSSLFIGNDSCPLHIAAAVGAPAVGIYGPSNVDQFRPIGPQGRRVRVVHADLPCSPCCHFVGNGAPWVPNLCYSYACLKSIRPEDVLAAATSVLAESAEEVRVKAQPQAAVEAQ